MPTNTKVAPNTTTGVALPKYRRSNNPLMLLLAIIFAGTTVYWLAYEWYGHHRNKHWEQSWNDISKRVVAKIDIWMHPQPEPLPETEIGLTATKQTNADFLTPSSIPENNLKIWKQTMQAIEELNKQASTSGEQPSYHNRLGILYAQAGDFAAALKQFNQAIILCRKQIWTKSSQPTSSDFSSLYVELTCAHSNLARIYDKLGDHDRVISELEELNTDIAFAGDNPSRRPVVQKNVPSSSIAPAPNTAGLNTANSMTPDEAALFAKAEALRQIGNLAEAMQQYIDLIKLNPNLAIVHQRLGLTAISTGDLWLAMSELQTAATLDSKDPDTYNDLGLVYQQLGDYPNAKRAFGHAHNIDPKHLSAAMNFADSLAATGSMGIALRIMQQASVDHPMSAAAHNNLGSLFARTGNDTAAAKEFARAVSLNSGLASAHYGLGVAALNLKAYPQAISELETAQKLNPGILDLQNKLDLANRCNSKELASAQGVDY